MTSRRSAALLLAAGALLVGAVPGLAAPPTATMDHPPPDDRYVRQQGASLVAVGDDPDDVGVERIELVLVEPAERDPACDAVYDQGAATRTFEPGTDPARLELPVTFPCNLSYEARITVRTAPGPGPLDGSETATVTVPFGVAVPPAPVAGLQATYDDDDRLIRLAWQGNTEPDLVGYLVERSEDGAAFQAIAELGAGTTSYGDDDLAAGRSYAYRLYAVRAGPDSEIAVLASAPSSATARTPAPAGGPTPEPPPTTAAPADGSGSGAASPDLEGFTRRVRSSSTVRRDRSPRTATTLDTGFSRDLPFGVRRPPADVDAGGGDPSVVADVEDEDAADRRALLEPLAAGLALAVGAAHLRFLIRRAAALEDPDAVVPAEPAE